MAEAEQGACIWYPASVTIFDSTFEAMLNEVSVIISHFAGLEAARRFEHLIQKIGAAEPTNPHCEVFFIGLQKEARGKGIGGSLLKPVLNYADTNKVGCYLVSSSSRNISFYERHGFKKYCSIQINDSYSMTGMWR
ncbi:GCN5-related N-acetyltransferase [Calothrix sp. NIES-4071]|nr:GCN5-related N-acetyltransferase [Calothrix sp. NIES-4071]BAZ63948.1 GCN5-related N-acetyltransferase [Calothrix sp. NIES-4105]